MFVNSSSPCSVLPESCDSHVDYLWISMMFLSAVWTLILMAPIHWWRSSDVMLNFFKSVLMKKKLIYILDGLSVSKSSGNFHSWVNYSLNTCMYVNNDTIRKQFGHRICPLWPIQKTEEVTEANYWIIAWKQMRNECLFIFVCYWFVSGGLLGCSVTPALFVKPFPSYELFARLFVG